MSLCIPLNLFSRKTRAAGNADHATPGPDSGTHFEVVSYLIQPSSLAGSSSVDSDAKVRHNCDYIDVNERCIALPRSIPGFVVDLIVPDPSRVRAQTAGGSSGPDPDSNDKAVSLYSPCWKRVEHTIRDITFVIQNPATKKLVEARPGSFYKASVIVSQSICTQLTGHADKDWDIILTDYAARGGGMNIEILIERGPDCV
ncbi:hypothetical protein PG995_008517 [Apiospora arundinis]|uniref:Uncharacterized protein n=1 Tax=Apiospora arundinis TaxID=335852 RepID=A0ABR2JNN9_9PEZI